MYACDVCVYACVGMPYIFSPLSHAWLPRWVALMELKWKHERLYPRCVVHNLTLPCSSFRPTAFAQRCTDDFCVSNLTRPCSSLPSTTSTYTCTTVLTSCIYVRYVVHVAYVMYVMDECMFACMHVMYLCTVCMHVGMYVCM